MFTSAELIEALRRRARRSLRPETPPGEFPPGWRAWFAAMRERAGAVTGAHADAIVALLAQRAPRPAPRRLPALSGPAAFAALWRQQWLPAPRDERGQRIAAFAISAFAQLLFSIFLLWLAYARYGGAPPVLQGEEVVQVEFIGEGTPREEGGGAPAGPVAAPAASASARPAAARSAAARSAPAAASAAAQAAPRGEAAAPPAPAAPQQPQQVQVTESTEPEPAFALPPPSEREVALPQAQVRVPQLAQAPETLQAVEMPSPLPAKTLVPKLPGARVQVPALGSSVEALPEPAPPLQGVAQREARVRAAQVRVPALGTAPEALPAPDPPLEGTVERSVSLPQATVGVPGLRTQPASLPGTVGAGAQPASSGGAAPAAGGQQASAGGANSAVAGAGAGPKPAARPGAWDTAKAGDDWGASDRNRAGGQAGAAGLFDENGRPRLPPGSSAAAGGGLPPGMVSEDIPDLDRAGTWLRRRNPLPYSPTAFDRYWLPGETLLEEWVRRGIREVQISIPGTSKKLHCVVSLLQLGGGCGIDDPDMQDQEARARKPPDVPFKPELQDK